MPFLALLGLVLLIGLVGHLFYRAFAPADEETPLGEVLFVQLLIGMLLCGWPALLLAELGLFSLLRLALVLAAGSVVVLALRWSPVRRWRWPRGCFDRRTALLLLLALGIAALLIWPGERVLGGNDPAVYLSIGASIARTGGIVAHDPLIAALPAGRAGSFPLYYADGPHPWLLPGFFVTDPAAGEVRPQFLHLYPTWFALFYAAGGIRGALAAVPFFPLLGLAAFFFLVRRVAGRWAAPAAVALLALNPAVVWFAREPVSETLVMPLLLGGWYLFDRAMAEPARSDLAAWAALALGEVALAKMELVPLPFLLCGYIALRAAGRPLRANERTFLVAYGLLLLHAGVHLAAISYPYVQVFMGSLTDSGVPMSIPTFFSALGSAAAAVFVLFLFRDLWVRPLRWLEMHQARARQVAAGGWLLLALYAAVVRPFLSPAWVEFEGQLVPFNDRLTFLRLSWYIAPIGLVLGVLGLAVWLCRRLNGPALPWVGLFLFEFAIYIHRTMDYAYHFWMMRRYLALILPFLTLGLAAALQVVRFAPLGRTVRRGLVAVLLILLLVYAVQADAPWSSRRDMAGTLAALDRLAARIPAGSPLLVGHLGAGLATPLRCLEGKAAFALPDPVRWEEVWSLLAAWPPGETDAYLLLADVPAVLHGGFVLSETGSLALDVLTTEQTIEALPRDAVPLRSFQTLLLVQRRPETPAAVDLVLANPTWTGRCLSVDLAPPAGPLVVQLEVAGFRPENVPPAQLQVTWDAQPVAAVTLERSWEMREEMLTLAPPAGWTAGEGDVRLELCVETWNPQATGYNDDVRDLGVLLRSFAVR